MYRSVFLPLDGSPFSEQALNVAVALIKRSGGRLELVHVHEPAPDDEWVPVTPFRYEGLEQSEREWAGQDVTRESEYLSTFSKPLNGAAHFKVLRGDVVASLEKEIDDSNPDVIVMAADGRGHVAEMLVRDVHRPVLVVRKQSELKTDHILIPLDGSRLSESVIKHALELVDPEISRITLLSVVYSPESVDSAYEYLNRKTDELSAEGFLVDCDVLVSSTEAVTILQYAEDHAVDVICMATHARTPVKRLLMGSIAAKVLHGAEVPVLLYRP